MNKNETKKGKKGQYWLWKAQDAYWQRLILASAKWDSHDSIEYKFYCAMNQAYEWINDEGEIRPECVSRNAFREDKLIKKAVGEAYRIFLRRIPMRVTDLTDNNIETNIDVYYKRYTPHTTYELEEAVNFYNLVFQYFGIQIQLTETEDEDKDYVSVSVCGLPTGNQGQYVYKEVN